MRTNNNAILAQPHRIDLTDRRCDFCVGAARLFAGAALVLGIVYVPSWVGMLTAWYLG